MILQASTITDFEAAILPISNIEIITSLTAKKKKTSAQIIYIKVKLFFWNLSPIHWYDSFKEIHIDMNEFISPKIKNTQK